jgi:N utilization substance protein B
VLKQTPPKVVISEFIGVAEAFSADNKEPKFVNAVLDYMAREVQPEAFGGQP